MRRNILASEDLKRLERVMLRKGGAMPMREVTRCYGIPRWIIDGAVQGGWVTTYFRKPPGRGRPSRIGEFRELTFANLPPRRIEIEPGFSMRHWSFAMRSAYTAVERGSVRFGIPAIVDVYQSVYRCKSREGARASASRLMKRRDVQAMRQWYFAKLNREVWKDETMPDTISGIRKRLRETGSRRANWF